MLLYFLVIYIYVTDCDLVYYITLCLNNIVYICIYMVYHFVLLCYIYIFICLICYVMFCLN